MPFRPFKPTPEEIIEDLPINRGYRKTFATVSADSQRAGEGRFYVLDSDDIAHDFLPFRFIDTAVLLCGRKIESDDAPGQPADPDDIDLCPECVSNAEFWENMAPADKVSDQLVSAIEGTVETKRQELEYCKRAVALIEEYEGSEDEEDTTKIFKVIALAFAASEDYDDASEEFHKLSKRSTKKFVRWGFEELPPRVNTALDGRVEDIVAIEKENEQYNDRIGEYLQPWREGLRDHLTPEDGSRPIPEREPSITREERLARRQAEREEHQRRVDAAANRPIVRKPRKRNRELEAAITKAESATGEERVAALRSLRQVALDCGDDEWASYAKTQLRGTRDCSS